MRALMEQEFQQRLVAERQSFQDQLAAEREEERRIASERKKALIEIMLTPPSNSPDGSCFAIRSDEDFNRILTAGHHLSSRLNWPELSARLTRYAWAAFRIATTRSSSPKGFEALTY